MCKNKEKMNWKFTKTRVYWSVTIAAAGVVQLYIGIDDEEEGRMAYYYIGIHNYYVAAYIKFVSKLLLGIFDIYTYLYIM